MSEEVFDGTGGACRSKPTDWWFPMNDKQSILLSRDAIKICHECDIRIKCLMYALRNETHGIWGGMRESERELERRRRGIQLSPEAIASMSQATRRTSRRLTRIDGTIV